MRLYLKFTGLFLFAERGNQLYVFAPLTNHLPMNEQHEAFIRIEEGVRDDGQPNNKPIPLTGRHTTVIGKGSKPLVLPDELPSLTKRANGGVLRKELFDPSPKNCKLQARIVVQGIDEIKTRSGAWFDYPDPSQPTNPFRTIAHEVFLDLGEVAGKVQIKTDTLDGGVDKQLGVEDDPKTKEERICVTFQHTPTDLKVPECKEYETQRPFAVHHFLSYFTLYEGVKSNPAPYFAKCKDSGPAPFNYPDPVEIRGVDPVMCIGGGG